MQGWVRVAPFEALPDGRGTVVEVGDAEAAVFRRGDDVYAIGRRCTHQGAPLERGRIGSTGSLVTVTCPAHGSMFDLVSGRVRRAPATRPLPVYETRVIDGHLELPLAAPAEPPRPAPTEG